jgi:hypothetical protein
VGYVKRKKRVPHQKYTDENKEWVIRLFNGRDNNTVDEIAEFTEFHQSFIHKTINNYLNIKFQKLKSA